MRKKDFEKYHAKYERTILGMARKLAKDDDALMEDLAQEARFALYKAQPQRAKTNLDAWLRRVMWHKMIDYLRENDSLRYESLDARLLSGDRLEQLNGELYLVGPSNHAAVRHCRRRRASAVAE